MVYLNLEDGTIENHLNLSVSADNTVVNFGLVPREVVKQILDELQESLKEAYSVL